MNKSALVIETPEKCADCRFATKATNGITICGAKRARIDTFENKPEWCPLVEIPQMDGLMVAATVPDCMNPVAYAKGWNDLRTKLEK